MKLPLITLFLFLTPALSNADSLSVQLKQTVTENLSATEAEDIDAIMVTMHSKSPSRAATKAQLPALFERFDLKYKLVKYEYISVSGEYAIARVQQQTTKAKGPAFRNNTVDSFMIFKQDKGKWRIWAQTVLDIKFE